jgi:hypothetical protein
VVTVLSLSLCAGAGPAPVDPRVSAAFGEQGVRTLQSPVEVETFRIEPLVEETKHPDPNVFDGHRILNRGPVLRGTEAAEVSALLLSDQLYQFRFRTGCGFSPGLALRFRPSVPGDKAGVDVLICLGCNEISIVKGEADALLGGGALLESGPGRGALLALAHRLFPDEVLWVQAAAQDARSAAVRARTEVELLPALRFAIQQAHLPEDLTELDTTALLRRRPLHVDARPEDVVRSVLRVFGVEAEDRTAPWGSPKQALLLDALTAVEPPRLLRALSGLRGDRLALLGAGVLLFRADLADRLPATGWDDVPALLARTLIEEGLGAEAVPGLRRWADAPATRDLLRSVGRAEIAERLDEKAWRMPGQFDLDPVTSVRPLALVLLALLDDEQARGEVEAYAPATDNDRRCLDLAWALLGRPDRLSARMFQASQLEALGAVEAIRRQRGMFGMRMLVEDGLHARDRTVQNTAAAVFAELVRDEWRAPELTADWEQRRGAIEAMELWWKQHGEEYSRRHPRLSTP